MLKKGIPVLAASGAVPPEAMHRVKNGEPAHYLLHGQQLQITGYSLTLLRLKLKHIEFHRKL